MMGYCYRVDLTRRVLEPFYGPEAYRTDTVRKEFPFGKGMEFPTGKAAFAAADAFAKSMMDKASSVSIWRLSGGKYGYGGGSGKYLKDDHDLRFTIGWDEFPNVEVTRRHAEADE
jgi:hypothetical protein